LFSVWILGEKFTTDMGIGLGCIILGILFIYRGKLKLF
jgi:drug/metabolite transporter (DMT)-like permease